MSTLYHSLVIVCVVLVAHHFTELESGRADYGYLASAELSRFVFWLLQKVRGSSDLPVIDKWEAYMLPNHSCFGAISEEHFMEGTRLLSSLEKKQQFTPKRVPYRLSSLPRGFREHHSLYFCRTFSSWTRTKLFLL